ncbi:hypothetical protein Tco_0642526 [Tanacetum coccineum]
MAPFPLHTREEIPIALDKTRNKMSEENVPAPTPLRSNEQILPFNAWLPIGKGNLLLDLYILAFTASANVPTIYIQQFWNTLLQDAKTGVYSFQLGEQWFTLNADLLRKALEITPVDLAHPFESPPAGEQVMDFVNELGYPEEIHFVSKMHEEFVQAIKIFFAHRANLNIPTKKRPGSPVHVTGDDFPLGNLKFILKGKKDEVFGKSIPNELITEAIRNSSYYQQYLEMVARKPTTKVGGQKKTSSKADKPTPVMKPAPAKQTKPVKEKSTKPAPSKKANNAPEPQIEDDKYNLQRGIQMSLESFQAPVDGVVVREPALGVTRSLPVVEGKGKVIATNEHAAQSLLELQQPKKKKRGENVCNTVGLKERTIELDKGQVGSDPCKTPESRPALDEDQAGSNPGQGHVALVGPNPEPMHEDFVATVCPQVHESLKHTDEEHVHIENPLSSIRTLSLMKNLDDAFTYGDQFLNDKPTKEEPDKANVETEVESMVMVLIHQASLSAPPLSTPVIVISSLKPVSPLIQEPVFTATTATITTTTTLPLPPPLLQQSTKDSELASRVSALEQNHDLYSKIDKHINEVVKEVVHNAHQALIRERFRDLSEFEMKEILCDRMFESGSYKSHPEHITLYEALEASMDHENKEEFNAEMAKSHKRRHDDQDPPPPPSKDSDQNKKKRHDSDTSASKQSQAQTPDWLKPVPEEDRPETPEPDWAVPPNDLPEPENNWANALSNSYQDPKENKLLWKTGDMGSFIKWYCKHIGKKKYNKADLEGHFPLDGRVSLDAYKLDFGLEELVPSLWIESKHEYDISAAYGLSHWWFKRKEFYITRHSAPSDRHAVRSHMRADYKEYKISEADFKNQHLNDFKDLNNQRKMMRESEVHKFSDGTLTRILEQLDHMVKDFVLFKFNPDMEHRIWFEDDKRRSKEFIEVIKRRLKIRRVFRSLESFVSERLKDVDYRLIQRTE